MFRRLKPVKISSSIQRRTDNLVNPGKLRKLKYILPLLVLVILGLAFFVYSSPFLKIKNVVVGPNDLSCASGGQVRDESRAIGKNFFAFDGNETQKRIKGRFLCASQVYVNKRFPNEVSINLQERKPLAVIAALPVALKGLEGGEATPSSNSAQFKLDFGVPQSADNQFLIDDGGLIYEKLSGQVVGLPLVYVADNNLNISKSIKDSGVNKTLEILKRLPEYSLEVRSVKIEEEKVLIDGEVKLVFSLKKDINYQLASLQLILETAKMNSKALEQVDLRFNEPVVVFSPKNE